MAAMAEALRPLVLGAQAGDRRALNTLAGCVDRFVRIFSGRLSGRIRRSQGSTIDFVLEGLAEAFAHLGDFKYQSDEEFYGWAAAHVRHRMAAAGRAEARQKRGSDPHDLGDEDAQVESQAPTASQVLGDEEMRTALGRAVLELQVEHAEEMEAVLSRVFEERSWSELVEDMGLSSAKRARTLFASGIDLLRPRVEKMLGKSALWETLGL